jgi:ElaB/YqjD/DUF883 family membrane-anchored ribosome-binding protein
MHRSTANNEIKRKELSMAAQSYPHDDTHDARQRARSSASDVAGQMADKAAEYATKAGQKVEQAFEGADATVRSVAEQGREAGERVQEVAGNLKGAIDKSVKDQPMATLAVAGAIGFVLGALWKS